MGEYEVGLVQDVRGIELNMLKKCRRILKSIGLLYDVLQMCTKILIIDDKLKLDYSRRKKEDGAVVL